MPYRATIEILIDVENETEAMDAIAETMRDHMHPYNAASCFRDWHWAENCYSLLPTRPIPSTFLMDDPWPDDIGGRR